MEQLLEQLQYQFSVFPRHPLDSSSFGITWGEGKRKNEQDLFQVRVFGAHLQGYAEDSQYIHVERTSPSHCLISWKAPITPGFFRIKSK